MLEGIPCPYCGEKNTKGSNICGRCMKNIRSVTNPERADIEDTAKTKRPSDQGLFARLRRWWNRRSRRAR